MSMGEALQGGDQQGQVAAEHQHNARQGGLDLLAENRVLFLQLVTMM